MAATAISPAIQPLLQASTTTLETASPPAVKNFSFVVHFSERQLCDGGGQELFVLITLLTQEENTGVLTKRMLWIESPYQVFLFRN